MLKATPGPWQWVGDDEIEQVEHPFTSVAELARIHGYNGKVERNANAHLIAAAPALYEALEVIASCGAVDVSNTAIVVGHDANVVLQQAWAALKQARGDLVNPSEGAAK